MSTSTRLPRSGGRGQRAEEPVEGLVVEGVAPLGTIDGHHREGTVVLDVDHRPVQTGGRFWAKAARPSAASSRPEPTVNMACNRGSASAADWSHTW